MIYFEGSLFRRELDCFLHSSSNINIAHTANITKPFALRKAFEDCSLQRQLTYRTFNVSLKNTSQDAHFNSSSHISAVHSIAHITRRAHSNSSSLIDIVHITALHASQDCLFQQQLTYENRSRHTAPHTTQGRSRQLQFGAAFSC